MALAIRLGIPSIVDDNSEARYLHSEGAYLALQLDSSGSIAFYAM